MCRCYWQFRTHS